MTLSDSSRICNRTIAVAVRKPSGLNTMSKRADDSRDSSADAIPSKRPRIHSGGRLRPANTRSDDIWGDDFADEDIMEMDLIASQACVEDTFLSDSRTVQKRHRERADIDVFGNNVIIPDTTSMIEVNRLRAENERLLNEFVTKDGESSFLRQQLRQARARVEQERIEGMRILEEQTNRHRSEINEAYTEKEKLKTQLDLQALEVANLMERCKLLESGNVLLSQSRTINLNHSIVGKQSKILHRLPCTTTATVGTTEVSLQTDNSTCQKKRDFYLKACLSQYPLSKIPESIFDAPLANEKPLVDIRITEKTGRRNLPILQEEETFRIFENPDIVKPVTTVIDNKKLSTEFVLPEIAVIQRKTASEINSDNSIPLMNKIVAAVRELMLNGIAELETILRAMKNDDVRDMDDLYFSDIYHMSARCPDIGDPCSSKPWNTYERCIETRRALGILSYVASASRYLANYIAGNLKLKTERDAEYIRYSQQMLRYSMWKGKEDEFEMLQIIIEFVSLIGLVRRSHQFSGFITAISRILCSVQKAVGFCSKGLRLAVRIFRELIFSRPLPICYVPLTELMATFVHCSDFLSNLCNENHLTSIVKWKDGLHFTPDACVLQVLMSQFVDFPFDIVTKINITRVAILYAQFLPQHLTNECKSENFSNATSKCSCWIKVVTFAIKMLCDCSNMNFREEMKIEHGTRKASSRYPADENYWFVLEQKRLIVLRSGIEFLCHLANRDPDILIRSPDIEDRFYYFIKNLKKLEELTLRENEHEALNLIMSTFTADKLPPVRSDSDKFHQTSRSPMIGANEYLSLDITTNFERKPLVKIQPTKMNDTKRKSDVDKGFEKAFATFKSLYNGTNKIE